MLREINAAHQNVTASHQFSQSQLTIRNMPSREFILSTMDEARRPETDFRTTGADTAREVLNNFIDYRA